MIEDTIAKIEARIHAADSISPERRKELLELLGRLKSEMVELAKTDSASAQSIAGFADVSTHEATRSPQNPELLQLSLNGLSSSVGELEKSHNKLTQVVNAISTALSNLGI